MRPMRLFLLNLFLLLPAVAGMWFFRADWYALFASTSPLDTQQLVEAKDTPEIPWGRVQFACDVVIDTGYRMERVDTKKHTRTETSRFLAAQVGDRFLVIQVPPDYDVTRAGGHRFLGKVSWMSGEMASQLRRDAYRERSAAAAAASMKTVKALLDGNPLPPPVESEQRGAAFVDLALPVVLDTTWSPAMVGFLLGAMLLVTVVSSWNLARAVRRLANVA